MKNLIITAIAAISVSTAAYAVLPPVLAKVNGKEVTKAEIEKSFANIAMDQPGQKKLTFDRTPVDFQKAFVEKYVEKMLIIDAARKQNLQDDPAIKQKMHDAEDFLIQQKFLTDLIMKKNSDAELKKMYDEKLKDKDGQEEIHAYHILVKTEDDAKKVKESLKNGGDFEKLAKQKSTEPGAKVSGGDLGYFTADQMVPEFSKAAFKLDKGEISDPVQTSFGWHIIKVVDKRPKKIPPFEKVKSALEKEHATDLIEDEVKRLKVSADIEYFGALKTQAKPEEKPLIKKVDDKKADDKKVEEKKVDDKKSEDKNEEVKKSDDNKPATPAPTETKKEEKPAATKAADKPAETKPKAEAKKPTDDKDDDDEDDSKVTFEEKFDDGTTKKIEPKAQ